MAEQYQNGGWYNGRQYWNGQFGAPGQIINPNQQGYGQQVSAEVNLQSDAAQGLAPGTIQAYLPNAPTPTFNSPGQVQNYTNGAQNAYAAGYQDPNSPQLNSIGSVTTALTGQLPTNSPTVPNLTELYGKLKSDNNVEKLEGEVADLKAQQEAIAAGLRTNKAAEMDKPVATNVIAGRISEQERMAQEQYDFVGRQLARKVDELSMRYKSIETIMNLTKQDYEMAKADYDSKFSQAMDMMKFAQSVKSEEQANARANAQIFFNAIKEGNLNPANMPPEMRASLNRMELQAGLPMGFFSSLQIDPKSQILHVNDKNGEVLVSDGNGGFKTVKAMSGSGSGSGGGVNQDDYTTKEWQSKVTSAINVLNTVDKSYQTIGGKAVTGGVDEFGDKTSYKNNGDRMLSRQEMEIARQKIIDSVGGNQELGYLLFNDAMNNGGFTSWGN